MRTRTICGLVIFLSLVLGLGVWNCPAQTGGSSGGGQTEKAVEISRAPIIEAHKIIIPGLRVEYPDRNQIVEIDNMELVGPNISVWEAISKGKADPEPQRLVDAIYLIGMTIEDGEEIISIDRCSLRDLWVTPKDFMQGNTEDPEFWEKNLPRIINAGSVKRVELSGMTVRPLESEEETVFLDLLTLEDVERGFIGSLLMKGLSVEDEDEDVTVNIASVRLEQADFSKLLNLVIQNPGLDPEEHSAEIIDTLAFSALEIEGLNVEGDNQVMMDRLAFRGLGDRKLETFDLTGLQVKDEEKAEVYLDSIRGRGFDYANLLEVMAAGEEYDPGNGFPLSWNDFALNDLTVDTTDGDHVYIREISASDVKYDSLIPVSSTFSVQGLEIDAAKVNNPKVKQTLAMFGYDKLYVGFKLDYAWDSETKQVAIKELSVGAEDVGKMILSLVLAGADFDKVKSKDDLGGLMPTLMLKRAELRYIDESLAPKALEFAAKTQNLTVEAMREQLIAMIQNQPMFDVSSPEAAKAVEALVTFIKDPKGLAIVAEPNSPAPIMMIAAQGQTAPDKVTEMLNLSLVVNNMAPVPLKLIKAQP